jgi:hypothetical protein
MSNDRLSEAYQLIEAEQLDEARAILEPLLAEDRDNADAWWLYVHAVTDSEAARDALDEVMRLDPNYPGAADLKQSLDEPVAPASPQATVPSIKPISPPPPSAPPESLPDDDGDFPDVDFGEPAARPQPQRAGGNPIRFFLFLLLLVIVVAGGATFLLRDRLFGTPPTPEPIADDATPDELPGILDVTSEPTDEIVGAQGADADETEVADAGDEDDADMTEVADAGDEDDAGTAVAAVVTDDMTEAADAGDDDDDEESDATEAADAADMADATEDAENALADETPEVAAIAQVTDEETPEETEVASPTDTPEPTATDEPPTDTPEPTATADVIEATAVVTEEDTGIAPQSTDVVLEPDTGEFEFVADAFAALYDIPDDGIGTAQTEAGNTLLVTVCSGSSNVQLREDLTGVMRIMAGVSDRLPDEIEAVGARMFNCDTDRMIRIIVVDQETAQSFAGGEIDDSEFELEWLPQ